jgi:hypothetical protein
MAEARCILPCEVRCPECNEWHPGAFGEITPSGVVPTMFPQGWENELCPSCNSVARCPNCGQLKPLPFTEITLPLTQRTYPACAECQAMPAKEQRVLDRRAVVERVEAIRAAALKAREEASRGQQ